MKVILQHNVQKLGKAGDVVDAAPGFFRNYLQPRKLAIVASEGTLKKREEDLESLRKKAEATHQEAVQLAEKITTLSRVKVSAKAGEGGKLYGKVTNKEIAQELHKHLGVEIDKRHVTASQEINTLGSHLVVVKLTTEVQAELTVEVEAQ